ncbi:histidine ammonia-lyase [Dermatophilus congolensis]|uniref:histidine ammonia-lyase n=1 Tax=Dermatophilus congolensis TaxID=1863 RepID=UPI001AAF1A8B|nr:histidine ammonia-lyase [Dermatophilus congolensis]MBO3142511.1 histidine ammonia-lyase [Dermatophilus congolensis]MBO3151501.1 histidine ammonia-lyase [Dermatophilus congolensis]MBO3161497.1 histidine ammonia-lyase [Dermatophilus congolensis]MBO3162786.1 histidine ammonia-lyase [Dermatophilus congolensis]MBO3176340.1 histidine ammonia-lyase [Dermatophilus congolensis]
MTRHQTDAVTISTHSMSTSDVIAVARHGAHITLSEDSITKVTTVRAHIDALASSATPVYGISTGFGALATEHIPVDKRTKLQQSLVRSHAAGIGPEVEKEVVRALMLLRLKTLASGHTGVRPETMNALAALLNAGITPIVHEFGSLGCSGDLAPLAHCALVLMGEGRATGPDGVERPVPELLGDAGITPIVLAEKEGLALINGTDGMLGQLILALEDLRTLVDIADVTAALSVEALGGTDQVFLPELHLPLRPHLGQSISADRMLRTLAGSKIVNHNRNNEIRVQDAYSLRCAPQVSGSLRDTLTYATGVAERELAAAIDNPVVLDDGRVLSNGNFHGAPIAHVLDFIAIPVADLASMAERRTDRMLDVKRSHGLPPFLADDPGTDSGLMIAQYTQAGIISELKRLATPASVDSIPSSAMQEDHVSMGWHAARKLRKAVDGLRRVLSIELVAATRAIQLRAPLEPGPVARAIIEALPAQIDAPGPDSFMTPQLQAAEEMLADGTFTTVVAAALGD